jgi:hypothetical protein
MIAPTIPEQLQALRDAAQLIRGAAHPTIEALRQAEVIAYVADRIEVFANQAAVRRAEGRT